MECHRIIKPGGHLVVIVPNFRSLTFEEVGTVWIGLDLPRHVQQFTSDSLRKSAQIAGFEAIAVSTETFGGLVEGSCIEWVRRWTLLPRKWIAKMGLTNRWARRLTNDSNATADRGEVLILHATRREASERKPGGESSISTVNIRPERTKP